MVEKSRILFVVCHILPFYDIMGVQENSVLKLERTKR